MAEKGVDGVGVVDVDEESSSEVKGFFRLIVSAQISINKLGLHFLLLLYTAS